MGTNILDFSSSIYQDLLMPADLSVSFIVTWIKNNIEALNNLLDTNFTIEDLIIDDDEVISPALTEAQKDIFKTLFSVYYYNRLIKKNLGAAAYTSSIERREGNQLIRTVNKNEVAKSYQSLVKLAQEELNQLIIAYKINNLEYGQIIDESCDDCGCSENINSTNYRMEYDRICYDLE